VKKSLLPLLLLLSACQVTTDLNTNTQPQAALAPSTRPAAAIQPELSPSRANNPAQIQAQALLPTHAPIQKQPKQNPSAAPLTPQVIQVSPSPASLIQQGNSISSLQVAADFSYNTSQNVSLAIAVTNPNGHPYQKVYIQVLPPNSGFLPGQPILAEGVTGPDGVYRDLLRLPTTIQKLDLRISSFGLSNQASLPIIYGKIEQKFQPAN
jgi:uncharacterized lipoprotein YmbA